MLPSPPPRPLEISIATEKKLTKNDLHGINLSHGKTKIRQHTPKYFITRKSQPYDKFESMTSSLSIASCSNSSPHEEVLPVDILLARSEKVGIYGYGMWRPRYAVSTRSLSLDQIHVQSGIWPAYGSIPSIESIRTCY